MILDLLSKRNTVTYNLKLGSIFGVCSAIFLSLLIDTKIANEDNLIDSKYFMLSRKQIYDLTALEDLKQIEVEDNLKSCKLIEVLPVKNNTEKFYYSIDEDLLLKFLKAETYEDSKKLLTKSAQKKSLINVPRTSLPSKRSVYIQNLKAGIKEEDPVLRQYYFDWIDSVYANPKGFLSTTSIKECIKSLDEYSKNNLKIKKEVMQLAIKSGSRNLDWSIEEHSKKCKDKNKLNITEMTSQDELQQNIDQLKNSNTKF